MKFFKRKKAADSGITKGSGLPPVKKRKRAIFSAVDKRQTFVLGMIVLSLGLFLAEFQFEKAGIVVAIIDYY